MTNPLESKFAAARSPRQRAREQVARLECQGGVLPTDQSQAVANAIQTLELQIAKLNECADGPTANDSILAWRSGLCVRLNDDGTGAAVSCLQATALKGLSAPAVRNGAGEVAGVRNRGNVAREVALGAMEMLVQFRAM